MLDIRRTLPRRISCAAPPGAAGAPREMHLASWADAGPRIELQLTDGLDGWQASLGPAELGILAVESHFEEDLDAHLQLTLESFARSETAFIFAPGGILSWSRECEIEGQRELVGGRAQCALSSEAVEDIRAELIGRLAAGAAALASLEHSIATIDAQTLRASLLARSTLARISVLESNLSGRLVDHLNEVKRELRSARDEESDTGTEGEADDCSQVSSPRDTADAEMQDGEPQNPAAAGKAMNALDLLDED